MALERDVREYSRRALEPTPLDQARDVAAPSLLSEGFNPYTGTPVRYRLAPGAEPRAVESPAAQIETACRWLVPQTAQRWELAALPVPRRTSAGIEIRWLEQRYGGIAVFEARRAARFDRAGRLEEIFGDHVPMEGGITLEPALDAAQAFEAAAAHVAALPLTQLSARLVLFYHHPRLRLGWDLELELGQGEDELQVIVDAAENPGEILLCRSLLATAARALVYRTNPGESEREEILWPEGWIEAGKLKGNNARCHFANSTQSLSGEVVGEDLHFAPAVALGEEQWQVNAFSWVNQLHDLFALLGFGEAEGNLQKGNPSGQGRGGDELEVRVFPQPLARGLATMSTRRDGKPCELRLGRVGEDCHAALDADVVIHEYTHAVINRLVGGPDDRAPFFAPQSQGLAEGYCDYFALTVQNHGREVEVFEIGAWIAARTGIRLRGNPYDDAFPGHFGRLGEEGYTDPHNVGEIWCVALLRFNAVLGAHLGERRSGHELGWQLVIDSLKLLPTGSNKPSFLEARDALLQALADWMSVEAMASSEHEVLSAAVGAVFTRLGMGPQARSQGALLEGVEADFGQ